MVGLDPTIPKDTDIHNFQILQLFAACDARVKPGHDETRIVPITQSGWSTQTLVPLTHDYRIATGLRVGIDAGLASGPLGEASAPTVLENWIIRT